MRQQEPILSELQYKKDRSLMDELEEIEMFLDQCEIRKRNDMRLGKYQKLNRYYKTKDAR